MRNASKGLMVAVAVALAMGVVGTGVFASAVAGFGSRVVVTARLAGATAEDVATLQKLDTTIISFTFSDQPLAEAMDFLGTLGGVNIVLDKAKIDAAKNVTLKLQNVPLRTAVQLVVEQVGLKWGVRDGIVLVSDEDGVKSEPITVVYDVSSFLAIPPQFVGPTIELPAIGMAGNRNGGMPTDTFMHDPGLKPKEDWEKSNDELLQELVDLIRTVIEPGSWDEPLK